MGLLVPAGGAAASCILLLRMDASLFNRFLRQTQVLRAPAKPLATFGATRVQYHLISPVEDMADRTRLREGAVVSQKPLILTPEAFAERFEGFGPEAGEFGRWLTAQYKDLLRALEYNFKNQGLTARVIAEAPETVSDRLLKDLDARDQKDRTVIRCPDAAWSLALMKYTLDESARSFPANVRDLERRAAFDPEGPAAGRRRREIEALFEAAPRDPAARETLGKKLRDYGLMDEYQDRFLSLF